MKSFSPTFGLPMKALTTGLKLRSHNIQRTILSIDRAVPNSAAKCRNVNFFRIAWVGNDAMPPFEVKTRYARPVLATVGGSPRGGLETGSIESIRIPRVDGHVINMAVAVEHLFPSLSRVL